LPGRKFGKQRFSIETGRMSLRVFAKRIDGPRQINLVIERNGSCLNFCHIRQNTAYIFNHRFRFIIREFDPGKIRQIEYVFDCDHLFDCSMYVGSIKLTAGVAPKDTRFVKDSPAVCTINVLSNYRNQVFHEARILGRLFDTNVSLTYGRYSVNTTSRSS
jgi:hypothetical protein